MAKAVVKKMKTLFTRKLGLNITKENSNTSECRSEVPCRFRNVVLEKDGQLQLEQSCEKRGTTIKSQGGQEYSIYIKTKD